MIDGGAPMPFLGRVLGDFWGFRSVGWETFRAQPACRGLAGVWPAVFIARTRRAIVGNLAGVHGREVVVEAELLEDQSEALD